MLVTSSYAWIILSRAPEITGIETRVGANGALEIALLSDTTYADTSLIRTSVGDSQVNTNQTIVQSNLTWGNVVDLSDEYYGLDRIAMIPARLNVADNGQNGGVVRNSMLGTVEFGLDGRMDKLNMESVSGVFTETGFFYNAEKTGYGVRGIGSVSAFSPQQNALTNAKSLVRAYISAASEITEAVWSANGEELLDIFLRRYLWNSNSFDKQDVAILRDTAMKAQTAYSYIDAALRQGIIGYAASVIEDPDIFRTLCDNAENTAIPLSMLIDLFPGAMPGGFAQWVKTMDDSQLELRRALLVCSELTGEKLTWEQISPVLDVLIDGSRASLGKYRLTSSDAYAKMDSSAILTLMPGSGKMAEIADYCGNYAVIFEYNDIAAVEVLTTSPMDRPYLEQVADILGKCECKPPEGVVSNVQLEDIYGFAMDMAFRSNIDTQLVLQTDSAARIDDGSETPQVQGNGSTLRMTSEQLTVEQIVGLMDAMRLGFLDNQNNLLAVAKANTSNYYETEEGVIAPLYLYDYEISDSGILLMGERRSEDPCIAELTDGIVSVITVVVWLDGDHVGNDLVTIREKNVESALNLQFASSVTLMPAPADMEIPDA